MSQAEITYLDLTEEQSRIVEQADGPMDIKDRHGNLIGRLFPILQIDLPKPGAASSPLLTDEPK